MPRIINAYEGNSAIGDSLSKLGEAIYGDQAKNEVYRQKAFGQKNINDLAVDPTVGLDDPRLAKGQLAIGGTAEGTFAGLGRNNASRERIGAGNNAATIEVGRGNNRETHYATDQNNATSRANNADTNTTTLQANDQTSDRASKTQLAIDARSPINIDNGDGTSHYDTKTNATANHLPVPATKEGVLGGMLREYARQQQQPPADGSAPTPAGNPFSRMPPQMQHVMGVDMPEQSLIEPRSGMTGISRDGGQTVILPNGASIPATGFQPAGQEAALSQARDNNVRAGAAKPLVVQNPANSQAAQDATRSSGLGPKVGTILNDELGAIPGMPAVLNGVFKSPQIAPGVQDARQNQDIRNNQARAVLLGAPGRQTTQAQKWVNELLPQGDAFSNPATEAAKIPKIVNALQGDHEQLRLLAVDPNTLPAERVKATQQMHQIENTIRMYTDPVAPTAGAPQTAAPPAAAPTAGAPQGDPLSQARAAIAAGANPAAVKQRLQQNGINPAGL